MPPVIAAIAVVGTYIAEVYTAVAAFLATDGLLALVAKAVIGYAIAAGLSALFAPKTRLPARQADVLQITLGESDREAIFGETATAGGLLDAFTYGNHNEWEVVVIALADHECESLEGFYFDDRYFAFTADGVQAGF